jgi:uncharacterized NAD(P)/FAD-binding protein YdhS
MDMNFAPPHPGSDRRCRVAIIGGGFTGAAVALNLLQPANAARMEILIVEPRALLGAGLAYSTTDPAHRVNVPAIRLLVHPDEPGAFHDWLETSGELNDDPAAQLPDGRRYPRRAAFGRYVNQRLMQAVHTPSAPPFRHLQASATCIQPRHAGYAITLDDGTQHQADIVVLTVSHPAPCIPPVLRPVASSAKFIANPWDADILRRIAPEDKILVIGTALSTADTIASLDEAGHRNDILAISRRGLVSRQRRPNQGGPFGDFSANPSRTAIALLQTVRKTIRQAQESFSCWEAVIEALRNQGSTIWAALPDHERCRFLRHMRPYWDVHRYQLAPQLGDFLTQKTNTNTLRMQAARIVAIHHTNGRFHVTLRHRDTTRTETFDAIINCTGPDHAHITQTNPALATLLQAGHLRPDIHNLGIDTDPSARALNHAGTPTPNLFIAGPLARAQFGELMGLPQVTTHAALVARHVAECQRVVGFKYVKARGSAPGPR